MKLVELERGSKAKIVRIGKIGELKKRFIDLGITSGEIIEFRRNAPLGDPQQYDIKDTSIAIRKSEAELIEITEISS